jgi:hypothetical protein
VFESQRRLEEDIAGLLAALREQASARDALLVDPGGVLFTSAADEGAAGWTARRFLEQRLAGLFALPGSLAAGQGPAEDVFEGWDDDEVLLVFLNGRVALVLLCPDAELARAAVERPFAALADRLLRWRPALRLDEGGRGLFFGRPRLDWVVIGRPSIG